MDSSQPFISDELLSAYIDGEISGAERTQVEAALAADESVAWRLQTLRQTVQLLNNLPGVAAPRSFALRADEVSEVIERRQQAARAATTDTTSSAGLWQALRALWQSGSPLWRNAATTSLAVFLALIVVDQVPPTRIGLEQGTFTTVSQPSNADASRAAPAAGAAAEEAVVEDRSSEDTADEDTADAEMVDESAPAQDEALVEQAVVEAEAETDEAVTEAALEAEVLPIEESAESEGAEVAANVTADTADAASADDAESRADADDGATADLEAAAPASAAEAAAMALPTVRGAEASGLGEAGGGNVERDEVEGGEALDDVEVEAPGDAADAAVMSRAASAAARRAPVEAFSATREVAADEASISSASAPTAAAASAADTLVMTETVLMTDTMDVTADVMTDAASMTDTLEVAQIAQPGPGDAEIAVIETLTDADSATPTDTLLMADAPASPLLPSVAVVTNVVTDPASSPVSSPASSSVANAVTKTGEVDGAAAERDDSSREVAATVAAAPTPATFSERAVDIDTYAERNLLTLQTAQLAAGLLALALALLWLRSRERK